MKETLLFLIYFFIQNQTSDEGKGILLFIIFTLIISVVAFKIYKRRKANIKEEKKFKARMKKHERLYREKKSKKISLTTKFDKTQLPKSDFTMDSLDPKTRKKVEKMSYFIDDDGSLATNKGIGSDINSKFLDKLVVGNPPMIEDIIFDPKTYSEIFNSKCPAFSNVNGAPWYLKKGDKNFIYRVLVTNVLAELNISRFIELNDFRQIKTDKNLGVTSWKGKGIKMDLLLIHPSEIHEDHSKFGKEYMNIAKMLPSESKVLYVISISGI